MTYLRNWWNGELQTQSWHVLGKVQLLLLLSLALLEVNWPAVLGDKGIHLDRICDSWCMFPSSEAVSRLRCGGVVADKLRCLDVEAALAAQASGSRELASQEASVTAMAASRDPYFYLTIRSFATIYVAYVSNESIEFMIFLIVFQFIFC